MKNRLLLLTSRAGLATEFSQDIISATIHFEWQQLDIEKPQVNPDNHDLFILNLDQSEHKNRENLLHLRSITDKSIFVLLENKSEIVRAYYLELGADGIIDVPLKKIETTALLHAVFRRIKAIESLNMDQEYHFEGCTYRPFDHIIMAKGKESILTVKEGQLLDLLLQNKNRIVSRERVFRFLYPLDSSASDNALNILLTRIRKKLRENECPEIIDTISGIGYRITINSE